MVEKAELRQIIRDVLAETAAERAERDAALERRIFNTFLVAIGIDPYQPDEMISQDLKDLRATLASADTWRKSVNRVQKVGITTAVATLVTGLLSLIWLGFIDKVKMPWH